MVSTTDSYLVNGSHYPFIHLCYQTPGADFVLLDVTDPARRYIEGWVDGGAKSKHRTPPAMDRAKSEDTTGHEVTPSPRFNPPHCEGVRVLNADIH